MLRKWGKFLLTSFHVELRRKTKVSRCEEYTISISGLFRELHKHIWLMLSSHTHHTPGGKKGKGSSEWMWGLYRSTKFRSCIALRNYVIEHKSRCMELSFAENHTTTYHVRNKMTSTLHDCTQSIRFWLLILISYSIRWRILILFSCIYLIFYLFIFNLLENFNKICAA